LRDKSKILETKLCKLSSSHFKSTLCEHSSNMNCDGDTVSSSHACVPLNKVMVVKPVIDDEVKATQIHDFCHFKIKFRFVILIF
jgi:hypothetical protein